MSEKRLTSIADVEGGVIRPDYEPSAHGTGIVHLGFGAFHRAHQAVYTDKALARAGGDWRITGVSLRSTELAERINAQNGLYHLLERGPGGTTARLVASVDRIVAMATEPHAPLAALADPATRVVTLTVTEKAYGIDRTNLAIDEAHPAIAADLANPRNPTGAVGLLVEALRQRRERQAPPFTVLSCDNLPDNGSLLRAGVIDFARRTEPGLAQWIAETTEFPSSMVDRIVPAPNERTLADTERLSGCVDLAAVETEPFHQWVIEDRFTSGRPAWEEAGAIFVDNVKPFEDMKLRMLNGAHSMLAYCGQVAGHKHVCDAMAAPILRGLVDRHMQAAAKTMPLMKAVDLDAYRHDLIERFANPAILHETSQIAMDGTQKLPQRILAPAIDTLARGGDVRPFAFAVAAWMRYCFGRTDAGDTYALLDPMAGEISRRLEHASGATDASAALHGLPGFFEPALAENPTWRATVEEVLDRMLRKGMVAALEHEAKL